MKSRFFIFCFIITLIFTACSKEPSINKQLQQELLQILEDDQKYRQYMGKLQNAAFMDSLSEAWDIPHKQLPGRMMYLQLKQDSLNLRKVTGIINEHGYPGTSLVGDTANTAAFYVLQHAPEDTIEKYFPLIDEAAKNSEMPRRLAAMMEDRMLMYNGEEQIYGTQVRRFTLDDSERLSVVWPIKDPETVNERRKEVGFDLTVEENARRLNTEYKPYTIKELEEITGKDFSDPDS